MPSFFLSLSLLVFSSHRKWTSSVLLQAAVTKWTIPLFLACLLTFQFVPSNLTHFTYSWPFWHVFFLQVFCFAHFSSHFKSNSCLPFFTNVDSAVSISHLSNSYFEVAFVPKLIKIIANSVFPYFNKLDTKHYRFGKFWKIESRSNTFSWKWIFLL